MRELTIVVHWLHVLAGIVWFGGHIFTAAVIWPALLRCNDHTKSAFADSRRRSQLGHRCSPGDRGRTARRPRGPEQVKPRWVSSANPDGAYRSSSGGFIR